LKTKKIISEKVSLMKEFESPGADVDEDSGGDEV
jgi:hypothetical protein